MRLLDLFCGAGGAAMGYHRAGFDEIVGVDHKPQKNYPFEFVLADAMTFQLGGFDAVHASPPCQAYIQRNKNLETDHPKLIEPVRERLRGWGGVYVIENVRKLAANLRQNMADDKGVVPEYNRKKHRAR